MSNKNSKRRQVLVNKEAKRTGQPHAKVIQQNSTRVVDSREHRTGTSSHRIFGV